MPKKSESQTSGTTRKADLKKAADAIAKKRGTSKEKSDNIDEEAALVSIAVKSMRIDVKNGKTKTYKLQDVLEEEDKRRSLR